MSRQDLCAVLENVICRRTVKYRKKNWSRNVKLHFPKWQPKSVINKLWWLYCASSICTSCIIFTYATAFTFLIKQFKSEETIQVRLSNFVLMYVFFRNMYSDVVLVFRVLYRDKKGLHIPRRRSTTEKWKPSKKGGAAPPTPSKHNYLRWGGMYDSRKRSSFI